jgi:hypothetical protein
MDDALLMVHGSEVNLLAVVASVGLMKEDPYGIRDSRSFLVALNLSVFSQTMIS